MVLSKTRPRAASDAGLGDKCRPAEAGTTYNLVFFDDGTTVKVISMDLPQAVMASGTLREQSESRLVYNLNAFAGGELSIRRDGSTLVALLAFYGSGVPWAQCVESPMTAM
jgi:hypothetical protein